MMRLGRTIILSGVVSVYVFVASVQAQSFDTAVQAAPIATDDAFQEPQPERDQTSRRQPQQEVPAIARPRGNAAFGTRGRSGRVEGKTDAPMGRAMRHDEFSYGTVISAPGEQAKRVRMRTIMRPVTEVVQVEISEEEQKEAQQLRELIKKLRETKEDDEEQRTALTKSIQAIFSTQFERDLKQREDALAPLEARVKALRKQLDKRQSAQGEIIDLRLKMIVNEIDGLTFPGEEGNVEETTVPARMGRGPLGRGTFDPAPQPLTEPRGKRSTDSPATDPYNPPKIESEEIKD